MRKFDIHVWRGDIREDGYSAGPEVFFMVAIL